MIPGYITRLCRDKSRYRDLSREKLGPLHFAHFALHNEDRPQQRDPPCSIPSKPRWSRSMALHRVITSFQHSNIPRCCRFRNPHLLSDPRPHTTLPNPANQPCTQLLSLPLATQYPYATPSIPSPPAALTIARKNGTEYDYSMLFAEINTMGTTIDPIFNGE